ncbi:MATE family efflux transporter [Fusobacterium sp. PH5-44]|uniref:MATE family efflux transporter n=1 Tax=unclassified Fusobacterium TaxID=2648384 RepID=UPI003D1AC78B
MKQTNLLTDGNPIKTLLKFSFPFLISSFLQALYGAVDLLVVGQYSTSANVAGVAIGSQIMQTITSVILGLTTGATILIGQYFGGKKERNAAKTVGTFSLFFGILGIIITIVFLFTINFIIKLVNTPVDAKTSTYNYLFICTLGFPFIIGYNCLSGILRGSGDSKRPLYFIIAACIINIVFDFLLVKYFHMGANGAAFATVSSQGVSFILALLYLKNNRLPFKFNKKYIQIFPAKLKMIFQLGFPIALQDGLISISFLIITGIINNMGVIASASVGVVEKIIIFAMLAPSSIAASIAIITAQNIGAKKIQRAKHFLLLGIVFSLAMTASFFLCAQFIPEKLTSIFSTDSKVIHTAAKYLRSYSLDCLLVCFVFSMNSFLSGSGSSLFPMIHSLIATFTIRIPFSYFLSKVENITLLEIGFAAPLSTLFSFIMLLLYFRYWNRKYAV